jgi:hypothetical protein
MKYLRIYEVYIASNHIRLVPYVFTKLCHTDTLTMYVCIYEHNVYITYSASALYRLHTLFILTRHAIQRVLLQSESAGKEPQLVINLIGRISEPFDWKLGQNLQHSTVNFQSDLRPRDFYRSIHNAQYLIAAIDNR